MAPLFRRLRARLGRARLECEVDEELSFHVEMEARANIAVGMSPVEARRVALRDLGGVEQTREAVRAERAGPAAWLWHDVVHAARALRRAPGFAATTVATLAIGIGGTTLVFSVVEAIVIRELPYGAPQGLVVLGPFVPQWSTYERLRAETTTFEELAAYAERGANVTVDGESVRTRMAAVSPNFLEVVQVRPAAGRSLSFDALSDHGDRAVLLSDRFWRARFGASRDAIGRTLLIDRVPHTIVGVLAPSFRTIAELTPSAEPAIDSAVSLFVPIQRHEVWRGTRGMRGSDTHARLTVIGRLRRGVSLAAASREVDDISRRPFSGTLVPSGTFSVIPASAAVARDLTGGLTILSLAVTLLFLVACANVANLQIERLSSRRREFAVRSALGAGSTRLVSVAFVEMFLLSLAGGTAGLLLAWGGVQVVTATAAPGLGRLAMLQVNGAVLAFAAAGTVTAAILAGCVPAWRISRADPIRGLQNGWNGALTVGRGGMSSHLVTWQVALAVVLLFAGALLVRNVAGRLAFDPGFRTEGILSAEVSPDRDRYPRPTKTDTEGAHARYCRRLLEGASRLPGVSEAALSHVLPGADIYTAVGMQSEGRAFSPSMNIVSAGYFSVLSIPIVAGRAFSPADGFGTPPVLVVNAALARQQWGTERDAIGRQVTISGDPRPWTVVGVSADARDQVLWRSAPPAAHALFTQAPEDGPMTILLRTTGPDPAALARPLAALGRSLDADQPIHRLMPLRTFVAAKLARERQIVAMMAVFALLTLVLAAVGVHGMLACSVALRAREFAIRRALGSGRRLIVALVMRRTCGLLGLGLVIALPISLALRWHLAGSVGAGADEAPLLLAAAVSVVTLAALAASIASARRAVGVEPTTVLRAE